ncbi:MAG: aminoglycoside 6-adenylyltransferase [Anaerolineae bacterium]|jgi:predicted nucleotidyltransferase
MASYFSADDRDNILRWIVAETQKDASFAGCVLVGSGAVGFTDEYSDIDLVVVVRDSCPFERVSEEWKQHVLDHLPVLAHTTGLRADRIILHNFYLRNYLEINNGILPLEFLTATRSRYKVLWDRTGQMQAILDDTWNKRKNLSPLAEYFNNRKAGIWHYINHAFVTLRRGRKWQALSDIEEIRQQVIYLRAYREGLEPKRNRDVDQMSDEFKQQLSSLLVGSLVPELLEAKLIMAARLFFQEARDVCRHLNEPYDLAEVEDAMLSLLGHPGSSGGHDAGKGEHDKS